MKLLSNHRIAFLVVCILAGNSRLTAEDLTGNISAAHPLRGNSAMVEKGCIRCHSIWGVGGRLGPDLATTGSDLSFQQMASMFWNHTPRMVQMLKKKGTEWPILSEQEMIDIISFLYYLKLLDKPGDPVRGQALFQEKKCAVCHSQNRAEKNRSLPLDRFSVFISSVPLAQAMWNAGRAMHKTQQSIGIAMPQFQGREMADLQAYLRRESAAAASSTTYLPLPDLNRGNELFRSKGCQSCHSGAGRRSAAPDLASQPLRKSISEICGILWNHSFAMQSGMAVKGIDFPKLEGDDLADILAYIYFLNFSKDRGEAIRGERLFKDKGCVSCHAEQPSQLKHGPNLKAAREQYTMLRLATSMWNHAPIMFETMESEAMKWIKLDPDDMQDLSKYLHSLSERK